MRALRQSSPFSELELRGNRTMSSETPLTLSNISFQTIGNLAPDCIASINDSGSGFTYLYNCGDHELQKFLRTGTVALAITSVVPNPAGASLRVQGIGYGVQGFEVQLLDVLGNSVLTQHNSISYTPTLHPIPLPSTCRHYRAASTSCVLVQVGMR